MFLEVHGEDTKAYCTGGKDQIDCMSDDKNRMFIMELVLHCSDISNPFKPYNLCAKWADLVVEVCAKSFFSSVVTLPRVRPPLLPLLFLFVLYPTTYTSTYTRVDVLMQEFCLQGDKEKSMGLEVSPMCDRDAISLCNMQMGFIEFVVAPLIIG